MPAASKRDPAAAAAAYSRRLMAYVYSQCGGARGVAHVRTYVRASRGHLAHN